MFFSVHEKFLAVQHVTELKYRLSAQKEIELF